jgi:hypothetical protein
MGWIAALAAFLAGAVITAGAEAVLRLTGYRYTPPDSAFRFVGPELGLPEFTWDARLFWRIRPGSKEISVPASVAGFHNEMGFRGPLVNAERSPGAARIAALGDSCTYGVGVPFAQSYVGIASSQVKETIHRAVEVIDGGVPGYTSYQGLQLLQTEILSMRPDVVTLYFGAWNDYTPAIRGDDSEKGQSLARPGSFEWGRRMFSTLRVFMLAQQAIARFNARRDPNFDKPGVNEYIDAFRKGQPLEGRRVSPEKLAPVIARVLSGKIGS